MKAKEAIKKVKLNKTVKRSPRMVKAVQLLKERVESGKKVVITDIQLEAGYAPSTAHDCTLTKTKAFKELLEEYLPDTSLLGVIKDLVEPTNDDKNTRLAAAKEGFRLKDRYPASKLQLNAFQDATKDLYEDQ